MRAAVIALGACLLAGPAIAQNVEKAPPGGDYKKVSELVKLPDFLPGLGTLYVNPKTLPAGPFLAYDHQGKLVSTIYMIPLKDLSEQKAWAELAAGRRFSGTGRVASDGFSRAAARSALDSLFFR